MKSYLISLMLLLSSSAAFGQAWAGLLTSARAIDWTHVGATIPAGSIPNCATQPSASISSINSAIAADVGGASYCVINIPAVSSASTTIVVNHAGKGNIILRGTGAASSIITYTGRGGLTNCNGLNSTFLCVWNGDSGSAGNWPGTNSANWTGGLSQGSTVLTLSNTTNLKVGYQIVLYQTDLSSDPGNIFPAQTCGFNGAVSWQGTGSTPVSSCSAGAAASQSQMETVTACNGVTTYGSSCGAGTSVTVQSPIYMPNWNSGQSPKAAWGNTMPISNVGVEDLEINNQTTANGILIEFHQSLNSWINGVATIANPAVASDTNHVLIWSSNHDTYESSYMYGSYPGSSGYGVDFGASSSDNLAQNSISQHMDTGFITETGIANVFGYDYSIDNYFGGTWQQDDEYQHSAGDYYNLREGIEGIGYNSDNIHGTHWFNTVFRSYFSGFDPTTFTGGKNQSQVAMNDAAWAGYDNWVALVLGTPGKISTYQLVPSSTTTCSPGPNTSAIYELGYSDSGAAFSPACLGTAFAIPNATAAQANSPVNSTMRFDNYDTVNGSVQRNSGEYASGAPVYPGLASPTTTIPASLYLTGGTPSWYTFPGGTTAPFPAVGPDVTGGNISGVSGFAWHGPAWNCYNIVSHGVTDGSPVPITFNRASCYTGSAPPTISLTVSTSGSGTGTVTGTNSTTGSYSSGTTIGPLSATATGGSTFAGWTVTGNAACSGVTTPCPAFSLTTTTTVTAAFTGGTPTCGDPFQNGPNFSGVYNVPPTVVPLAIGFTSPTSGCNMFATFDGSSPTCSSSSYGGSSSISATTQIRVIACQGGFTSSNIVGGTWTINSTTQAAAPTFSPVSPYTGAATTVTASTATSGCSGSIFFGTTNPPTVNTTTFSFTSSTTLFAYVHGCAGFTDSTTSSWSGTLAVSTLAAPSFSPNGSADNITAPYFLPSSFSLTVTPTVPGGSKGCYRTDGTPPAAATPGTCDAGSTTFTSGTISITANHNLQMLSTEVGFNNSSITSTFYNQRNWILDTSCNFNGGPAALSSVSCTLTPTAGDLITVGYVYGSQTPTATVTDNVSPGTYGLVNSTYFGASTFASSGRTFRSGVAGISTTVTLTLSGASGYVGLAVEAWKPSAACNATVDSGFTTAAQAGSTANPTLTSPQTPSNANELVYANLVTFSKVPTAGAGFTLLDPLPNGPNLFSQATVQASATATSLPYTMVADPWQIQPAAFFCASPLSSPTNVQGSILQGVSAQ